MIQKGFDDVTKADIDGLIANGTIESKTLEYKQELPGNLDADKKEFLADVSSFGNASGGDIVYGIKAAVDADGKKTGAPEAVQAITDFTADDAKLRLEETIRNGIDPRLRVQIKEIAGWGTDGEGFVVLLRIPKSFALPHMVTFKGTSRFLSRNSAGKYQLDVHEIRSAYLATESQAERIKQFRQDRLGKIIADETPVALSSPHRLVLHLIPLASFLNNERLALSSDRDLMGGFPPINSIGWNHRFNLDGFLTWEPGSGTGKGVRSYCQVFFDGSVEAVYSDILRSRNGQSVCGGTGFIGSVAYEKGLLAAVKAYLSNYKKLGVEAPVVISVALLGCKGSYLYYVDAWGMPPDESYPVDRDVVILPDAVIEDLGVSVATAMKPIFDAVWNASGFPRSLNYNEDGVWTPRA